ncbi:hypothetical protein SLA2020_347530 [Shorea laevis]
MNLPLLRRYSTLTQLLTKAHLFFFVDLRLFPETASGLVVKSQKLCSPFPLKPPESTYTSLYLLQSH